MIGFMGATPYVQRSMVGLSVYNGPYRVRLVVSPCGAVSFPMVQRHHRGIILCGRIIGVWYLLLGDFKQSDPWCRCSSDSAAPRGFFIWSACRCTMINARFTESPTVFPVGCFPFFFVHIHRFTGKAFSYLRFANLSVGWYIGNCHNWPVVTTAFGAFPRAEGFFFGLMIDCEEYVNKWPIVCIL